MLNENQYANKLQFVLSPLLSEIVTQRALVGVKATVVNTQGS